MTLDLAQETRFALGALEVRPPTREVVIGGQSQVLEPRIMQVLVVLARRPGEVVSRDELVERCWKGRSVGDDAIARCIAAIRRLAETHGGFSVETVARVGYRLQASTLPSAASALPILAVLAFDNLSDDADVAYFSDGISEEILQTVARGASVRVIGRSSSFQFRGVNKNAKHVATELNATHVLDGSVRRNGSRVRIFAQLIECVAQTTLWSDRFDGDLSDIFALQDEIAAAVAGAMKVVFAPVAKGQAVDPEGYRLYLKALEIRNRGLDSSTLPTVASLIDAATALASDFARAWALSATIQAEWLDYDGLEQSNAVTRAKVKTAAETALRLDPGLGAAYQALSRLEPKGCFAEREALHEKALSVAPNDPTVLTNASLFFAEVGRIGEAHRHAKQAYEVDPMYPWAACWYATLLDEYGAGPEEKCGALWRTFQARWPDNALVAWNAIGSAFSHRDWARVDELTAAAAEHGLDTPTLRAIIAGANALRHEGPQQRSYLLQGARRRLTRTGTLPVYWLTGMYRIGLKDETFELAGQASFAYVFDVDERSQDGAFGSSSMFAPYYSARMMHDIRFVGLCAKLGLCDYWVTTGRWPDCAEDGVLSYDFKAECRRWVGDNA